MLEVSIKFKQVKYPKMIGKTTGGLYTNATLKISEDALRFDHNNFKVFKYLFNQLPIQFYINQKLSLKIYINQFDEYKIKYSTANKDCEITFKIVGKTPEAFRVLFEKWKT